MNLRLTEFLVLGVINLSSVGTAAAVPVTAVPVKVKPIAMVAELHTDLQPVAEAQTVYIPPPAPDPAPAAPSASGSCQTGVTVGDYYTNLVMQRESGGNSCAMNPSGACGLFQALPCSKMGCSLYDVPCQESWGESYIASVYGSSANAWAHELASGWY